MKYFLVIILFTLVFTFQVGYAERNETNTSEIAAQTIALSGLYTALDTQLKELESVEQKGNVWTKIYSNYLTYQELKTREENLYKENFRLSKSKIKNKQLDERYKKNSIELKTIEGKLALLKEFQEDPFKRVIEPPAIEEIPEVGNPVGILGAVSYKKKLDEQQKKYEKSYSSLVQEIESLKKKQALMVKMLETNPHAQNIARKIEEIQKEIDTFEPVLEIFATTKEVYSKKIEEIKLKLDADIKQEYEKMAKIAGVLAVFFLLFLFIKYLVHRYMSNKDSYYTVNKAANFVFLTIMGLEVPIV